MDDFKIEDLWIKMIAIKRVLFNYSHSAFWIIAVLILTSGTVLFINSIELEPVHILIVLLIGIGGVAIFYYLRNELILAIYYWVTLLWPYLGFEIVDHPIKFSYLMIPLLCFVILTIMFTRNIQWTIYSHPIFTLSALYTIIIFISSILNLNYLTSATYSFIALWLLGFVFFTFYLGYISTFDEKKVISLAENTLTVFMWMGFIAFIIGLLEYYWPDEVHKFYNPRGGEELWGSRGVSDFILGIDIKRIGSIVGSPNVFGQFMSMVGIIVTCLSFIRKKYVYLMLLPISFISVAVLSNSRGALISFVITLLIILLYFRRYFLVFTFGASIALLSPFFLGLFKAGYSPTPDKFPELLSEIPTLSERLFFWYSSLSSLRENPIHFIYGYGPSNEILLYNIGVQGAHNIIVTNLHCFGIVGVTVIFLLIVNLFRCIKGLENKYSYNKFIFTSFLFVIFGLIVHSFIDDIFYFNSAMMLLLFPLLVVIANLSKAGRKVNAFHKGNLGGGQVWR